MGQLSAFQKSAIFISLIIAATLGWVGGKQQAKRPQERPDRPITTADIAIQGDSESSAIRHLASVGAPRPEIYQDPTKVTNTQTPPAGKAVDVLRELIPRAEKGDARAAVDIFLKLNECESTLTRDLNDIGLPPNESGIRIDEVATLKAIEKSSQECEGIKSADFEKMGHWLSISAERGDLLAQLLYANFGYRWIVGKTFTDALSHPDKVQKWRSSSMRYLNNAANHGVPEALQSLSDSYVNGVKTDKNPVNAYAYYAALARAYPGTATSKNALSELKTKLGPRDLIEGEKRANDIYNRCCLNLK